MIWQNPWAWAGLATLALPVLVHLFSRRQTRVLPFPSLRFVDVSRLLPTRRTQLSDLPLLLLRLLLLAVAVAALAQPLFTRTGASAANATARVLLIDSLAVARDASGAALLPAAITERISEAAQLLRVESVSPRSELAGAAAWLSTRDGSGELLIVSDFRDGVIDSLDIAALPANVAVQLMRVPEVARGARSPAQSARTVEWATSISAATFEGTTDAVRAMGGGAIAPALTVAATSSTGGTVIVVASPDADSLSAWMRTAIPLSSPWMGDAVLALHADTTLVSALQATSLTDTTVSAPFVVMNAGANDAPAVLAGAIPGANGADRLLLIARAPASSLATAALLLAASRDDRVAADARILSSGTATFGASTTNVAPDDARLQRWATAPRTGTTTRAGEQRISNNGEPFDATTGSSDARWLWLVVVALLIGETILRRRIERNAAPEIADRTPTRTPYDVTYGTRG